MIPFVNLPVKIVKLFTSNVAPSEVAAGVCLGMFLGFTPLNGPMAVLLVILMFVFKINRLASILVLPVFKLFYVAGVSSLADALGGVLLIEAGFLKGLWRLLTTLPVVAYLDLGNTLVTGGLVISFILLFPVYKGSEKGIIVLRERYFDKIRESKFVKWFMKLPLIGKIASLASKAGGR
ncbi:MAG: DUF2062 domain-containing protein [Candidatus Omnitrophica bacterium]|nr:DUF2062 domain-containing protein [Candidatus Omnitrophota bacterium]